jgi:hypothetical protein
MTSSATGVIVLEPFGQERDGDRRDQNGPYDSGKPTHQKSLEVKQLTQQSGAILGSPAIGVVVPDLPRPPSLIDQPAGQEDLSISSRLRHCAKVRILLHSGRSTGFLEREGRITLTATPHRGRAAWSR